MTALETKDKANYYIVGYKWLDMEGLVTRVRLNTLVKLPNEIEVWERASLLLKIKKYTESKAS